MKIIGENCEIEYSEPELKLFFVRPKNLMAVVTVSAYRKVAVPSVPKKAPPECTPLVFL